MWLRQQAQIFARCTHVLKLLCHQVDDLVSLEASEFSLLPHPVAGYQSGFREQPVLAQARRRVRGSGWRCSG